jgi:2-oxoisovalerate dehydrogenase E1 component
MGTNSTENDATNGSGLAVIPTAASDHLLPVYQAMVVSRRLDEMELNLVGRGEAFFHVSSAGHEGMAVFAPLLRPDDWLHCHYRDKALMLARGVSAEAFLNSLLCNGASHSRGRQMSAHMSNPARHILSLVGPVGNNALQAVGVAAEIAGATPSSLVLCCVGDGTSQQGEFLEAVAEAVRESLPVVFVIEDNGLSISTLTKAKTWFSNPQDHTDTFYGLPIRRINGRQPHECLCPIAQCLDEVRGRRNPALIVFSVERLANHTNADDERTYRSPDEINSARSHGDPNANLRAHLIQSGIGADKLDALATAATAEVASAVGRALQAPGPAAAFDAKPLLSETIQQRQESLGQKAGRNLTMLQAMREVLRHHLAADSRVSLFGQDIEDPKGDVFGLTRGLSTQFPKRVVNAPLSESTIVGKSIGRALAGGRPVAMIQFADFLPLAFNQIISELGSMHWRTDGGWQCPVIITAPCGGYRPGLGPFHAQTMESVCAHIPGIDVLMPSSAADAAGLLNAAFASGRPTLFLYPKVCLNDPDRATSDDIASQFVPLSRARHLNRGNDLSLVTYGSTTYQCARVAATLQSSGVGVDLIDLRSLSPWDQEAVCESARRTGKLLIVHEDNLTCSLSSEIAATAAEKCGGPLQIRRVTRPDTYVPCNFANQLEILPSFRRILEAAAELVGFDVVWRPAPSADAKTETILARGSSPADQTISVTQWRVKPGETVEQDQVIAELEADKAVFEFASPSDGMVESLLVDEGSQVRVGEPLMRLRGATKANGNNRPARDDPGTPVLTRRSAVHRARRTGAHPVTVHLSRPVAVQGSRLVTNEELIAHHPVRAVEDIVSRTGIRSRRWVAPGETTLTLAESACRRLLAAHALKASDLDAIICSTTTPLAASPSLACMLLGALANGDGHEIPAHDISAACTGYLYALAAGYDFLQAHPDARVLVVTSEVLSPLLNLTEFDTAILFGDAATATLLSADSLDGKALGALRRPVLAARGDDRGALRVQLPARCLATVGCGIQGQTCSTGAIQMDGGAIFSKAVRAMLAALRRGCAAAGIPLETLEAIVPHQANGRILAAVAERLGGSGRRVVSTVAETGNTSSSSIPLALALHPRLNGGAIGLCAFGGGFTSGAALIDPRGQINP